MRLNKNNPTGNQEMPEGMSEPPYFNRHFPIARSDIRKGLFPATGIPRISQDYRKPKR
jgi:hypothetical protein